MRPVLGDFLRLNAYLDDQGIATMTDREPVTATEAAGDDWELGPACPIDAGDECEACQ